MLQIAVCMVCPCARHCSPMYIVLARIACHIIYILPMRTEHVHNGLGSTSQHEAALNLRFQSGGMFNDSVCIRFEGSTFNWRFLS